MPEERYCGPCGEFYNEGDILAGDPAWVDEVADAVGGPDLAKACPTCGDIGKPVDELAEAQAMQMAEDFHDGGSTSWAMAEKYRGQHTYLKDEYNG